MSMTMVALFLFASFPMMPPPRVATVSLGAPSTNVKNVFAALMSRLLNEFSPLKVELLVTSTSAVPPVIPDAVPPERVRMPPELPKLMFDAVPPSSTVSFEFAPL